MAEPITLEDVKTFLQSNGNAEGLQAYLAELATAWIKSEVGIAFLISVEGQKLYQPELDRQHSKAIDTFKTKTMPDLIAAEVEKRVKEANPEETPEQKQLRLQNERILNLENQTKKDGLIKTAIKKMTELKLHEFIPNVEAYIGADEESTIKNIEALKTAVTTTVDREVKEKLPGRKIIENIDPTIDPNFKNPFEKGDNWNLTEQGGLFKTNRDLALKLQAEAKS